MTHVLAFRSGHIFSPEALRSANVSENPFPAATFCWHYRAAFFPSRSVNPRSWAVLRVNISLSISAVRRGKKFECGQKTRLIFASTRSTNGSSISTLEIQIEETRENIFYLSSRMTLGGASFFASSLSPFSQSLKYRLLRKKTVSSARVSLSIDSDGMHQKNFLLRVKSSRNLGANSKFSWDGNW